jgi:CTP:molybdopterin cytidylyltransferase MocA
MSDDFHVNGWPNDAQATSLSAVIRATRQYRPILVFDASDMPKIVWPDMHEVELIADPQGKLDVWRGGNLTDQIGMTPEQAVTAIFDR